MSCFEFDASLKPVGISALHSHDATGIVHIEAPTRGATYTLGQFLNEWGVLNGTDKTPGSAQSSPDGWTVTLNGKKHDGAISTVVLRPHEERSSSPTARHRSRCLRRTHSLRASRPEVAEIRRAFGFQARSGRIYRPDRRRPRDPARQPEPARPVLPPRVAGCEL